jgi:hypothetical protein
VAVAVDPKVVGLAAALQIAIVVPPALLVAALRRDDLGAESNLWLVAFFLALVVGPAAAGVLAGRRRPDAPLLHGAAGAFLAWALLTGVSLLRAVAGAAEVAPLLATLLTIAPIQVGVGVLGALFARPPRRTGEDGPMTDANPTPTADRS